MKKAMIILLVGFFLIGAYFYFKNMPSDVLEVFVPQQQCPEAWFKDEMPVVGERSVDAEYMIVDGDRKEMYEMDVEWIRQNCEISGPISVF